MDSHIGCDLKTRRRYVSELDTLRAGAVLAVLATHADLPFSAGGVLGVDVFFVLSGFLITALLVDEHDRTGGISWKNFYARRALRLLPALFVATIGTLLMVLFTARGLGEVAFAQIGTTPPPGGIVANTLREVGAALLYVANFGGSLGVQDVFFGHTWSLAVEEQFYFVWPPLIAVLLAHRRREHLLKLVVGLTLGLIVLRVAGVQGPGSVFQLRFDQLLLGVCARLFLDQAVRARLTRLWPAALILLVPLMATGLQSGQTVGGRLVYTVAGVCAAVIVVACWTDALGEAGRIFRIAPVLAVGRLSYGVYLFHLPIFRRIAMADFEWPSAAVVGVKFGLTALITVASFWIVERPALRLKTRFASAASSHQTEAHTPSGLRIRAASG